MSHFSDLPTLAEVQSLRRASPKPEKGSTLMESRERRKDIRRAEEDAKDEVRARDLRCRWPKCENCRHYKPRLEVAHWRPKGMGGDHGARSAANQMLLLDFLTHQSGPSSLEQHGRRIEVLDSVLGTAGPLEFWALDERGAWYLVARERAPFVYERD
jgi:hypothetical protein